MRAAVIRDSKSGITLEEVPDPSPGPGEVLIAVDACGICGTDIHIADGEYSPINYPVVVGHEFAGTIRELGKGAPNLIVGDRVAVDPSRYCGACEFCQQGRDNLCTDGGGLGSTVDGAFAELVVARARDCYRIPSSVDFATAALTEPLACAVHGFDLLTRRLGDHYLVYGAGTMGLLMASLAKFAGASSVSVVDPSTPRLDVATRIGADAVAATAAELQRATRGWDVVIDCSGARAAIEDGISRVRRGGTFQQFGVAAPELRVAVSPFLIFRDEITVIGSRAVLRSFDRAAELISRDIVNADAIVSHHYSLNDLDQALATARSGKGTKVLVHP